MKKRLFGLLLSLLLVLSCTAYAFAEGDSEIDYVVDAAGILSSSEYNSLLTKAQRLSRQYSVGIYIAIVDDMGNWGYRDIEQFTQDLFEANDCGIGEDRDGIMLCLSMAERDYDLDAHGNFANYAFTDYGKEVLAGSFLDDFRRNDWYGGFNDYLDKCESMLISAAKGEPVDVPGSKPMTATEKAGISAGAGSIIAAIVSFFRGLVLKNSMKSANEATNATRYLSGNVHFTAMDNILLHRNVSRRVISASSGGGGGHGGGTTINSAGHSHHSGKF